MVGQNGDLRRKRAANSPPKRGHAAPPRGGEVAKGVAAQDALDVASYISDMTAQLEAMSLAAGLDLLAYFLGMARSEADLFVRTNATADEGAADAGEEAGADGLSDEGQATFEGPGD